MATRPKPSLGREQHRAMDCESYDSCLSVAARERWCGWDCRACPQAQDQDVTVLKLMRGPDSRRLRPLAEHAGKPTAEEHAEALAVMAALAKAEATSGGPASPRMVGAYLGMGGRATQTLLATLEDRGMVKRRRDRNSKERWSLK